MDGRERILRAIETLARQYMHEKGWSHRRARRAAKAKVGRHLRKVARHTPSVPRRPVLQTLGVLRVREVALAVWLWIVKHGVYMLAGAAIGALIMFKLVG